MSVGTVMRKSHRVLSMITTVAVIANIVALIMQSQAQWIGFLALLPLVLLMVSGIYLFFQPYLAKSKSA